jgi:hypothetical protein
VVRRLQEVGGSIVDPETASTVAEIGIKWPQHPADIGVVEGGDFFGWIEKDGR